MLNSDFNEKSSLKGEAAIIIFNKTYEQFNKIFFNCPCGSIYCIIFNFRTYY